MKQFVELIVAIVLCAILFYVFGMGGCEAEDLDALEAIRGQGLTSPTLYGNDLLACADSESSRKFTARNHQGELVHGTVCCGMFGKSCTIRWGK
jgi:hypothetical protein